MSSLAFVGAGPTTLYTLDALLRQGPRGVRITVFEAQAAVGLGTPYRPGWNDPAMLSNIASAEIPPLTQTLLAWLQSRSPAELEAMGVDIAAVSDRAFLPRLVLGRYFESQFQSLLDTAAKAGVRIDVRAGCRVVDAVNRPDGLELVFTSPDGKTARSLFDHVVLATGHQWPSRQEARPGYYTSPWPARALAAAPPTDIGVRGSSLTAIDTAVALAAAHGDFVRDGEALTYRPGSALPDFHITLMSRKGLLPEADFYFPLPHAPLAVCNPAALAELIDRRQPDLLDAAFDLFRRELLRIDPAYAEATGLAQATLEPFGEAYFQARADADPFVWAEANLAEARANHATKTTVSWRDAILRMHEPIAAIVPHLSETDFERFNRSFKPVFVDAYGAVPHESVERMLALHRAGRLSLIALGDDYRIDTRCPEGGARLVRAGRSRHFPVFIEATGQRPLSALQFPFLSLIEQGIVRDETAGDPGGAGRGIVVDDLFRPIAAALPADRLFCLSLPFILGRHPFAQGVTSSRDMGEIVGGHLGCVLAAQGRAVDTWPDVA